MDDPFRLLGLSTNASAAEVRKARRDLAKEHHPDAGGNADLMRVINVAAGAALRILADPSVGTPPPADAPTYAAQEPDDAGMTRDIPSFTVEALPVETFEALLVVTSWIGEVIDDEPPYRLDVLIHTHAGIEYPCWCRLELVPDAGASTVSIGVGSYDDQPTPSITALRDLWVTHLNRYDWT
ncbi:MAG: hypothetical protein ACI9N0_002172 [Ilumatobacter sp.]|jgi:hypothetical protein